MTPIVVGYVITTRVCPARHAHTKTFTIASRTGKTMTPDRLGVFVLRADTLFRTGVL